ncbi:hypothetical protein [Saccharopolyspora griseoalba]|uniref:Uncharacterized protein n=1 Tax=Saccharopolyspora griseoalba TaxID=1431848 RepID=A0ABW2LJF2_9PSEU
MRIADFLPGARSRALVSAQLLDEVVDAQLDSLPRLPPETRGRQADHLAELVQLGQFYRHYARGWISRRELQRRCLAAVPDPTRGAPVQLVDGE